MLETVPRALGAALPGVRAGLDGTAYHAAFAEVPETLSLTSPAFADGGVMPARFTQDGAGASPDGARIGTNGVLKRGWPPPDPPTWHGAHAYLFQIYALDRTLDLPDATGRGDLVAAMGGRVLGRGRLTGTYART